MKSLAAPSLPMVGLNARLLSGQLGAAADGALPFVVNRNRRFTRVIFEIFFENLSKNIQKSRLRWSTAAAALPG